MQKQKHVQMLPLQKFLNHCRHFYMGVHSREQGILGALVLDVIARYKLGIVLFGYIVLGAIVVAEKALYGPNGVLVVG